MLILFIHLLTAVNPNDSTKNVLNEFQFEAKGRVIKVKNPEKIIRGIHDAWCLDIGFPTVGF